MGAEEGAELTCADWLGVLRPHLSGSLFGPHDLARFRSLWRLFPSESLVALELRLGEEGRAPRVDCAVRLGSPDEVRPGALRLLPHRQRGFLRRWGRDVRLGFPAPIPATWLELDLDVASGSWRRPLLCAGLDSGVEAEWLTEVLLPALCGRHSSPRQARLVRRVVGALPAGARVLYAFSLQPRHETAVRLEVFGLAPGDMVPCLRAMGSPAAAAAVVPLLPLVEGADRHHLALDLAEEVLPRVGLECGWKRHPGREPCWRRALDGLVGAGLATPSKREAILAWPGYDTLWSAPCRWPEGAIGRGGYLVRCLSHLKLVASADQEPEAKAYLLFRHYLAGRADESSTPSSRAVASVLST